MVKYTPAPFVEFILRKYTKQSDTILDVGCGPAAYRNSTSAKYVGLDMTDKGYGGCPGNVDIVASAMEIPVSDNTFDLIFSKSAFFQFPDPLKALIEFKRILKPGGRVILFDYNRRQQKRLEIAEGHKCPCWTQRELRALVRRAGFKDCKILFPVARDPGVPEKLFRLIFQELMGQWAIVTGIK